MISSSRSRFVAAITLAVTGFASVAPTGGGLLFRTYGFAAGGFDSGTIAAQPDGRLDSFAAAGSASTARGTNTDRENGSLAGVIGWSRWGGGTTTGATVATLPANGGGGMIWGTPVTAMPTSGTANYSLAGATAAMYSPNPSERASIHLKAFSLWEHASTQESASPAMASEL